ncbi:MAG: YdeI/OmpD-associated family protein [Bacteroidetes bacterium]|nr:YdeI/OmpD-associated family protein [Bacteroidota bacterium]
MSVSEEFLLFESQQDWAQWLSIHQDSSSGIWMMIAKKQSHKVSVNHAAALEIALCYGWIDAIRKSLDENFFLQRFTPRKAGSNWSKVNREKVEQLIAEGKMLPPGIKAIEVSKKNGSWDRAYEPQSTIQVPPDLEVEFKKSLKAKSFFDQLDSRNRYAILFRISTAVKPETRHRRIEQFVKMLEENRKIY